MTRIRKFLRDDADYFKFCKHLIGEHNYFMLLSGTVIYALVLIFYTILTVALKQALVLKEMYYIFDAIHIVFCLVLFLSAKKWKDNFIITQVFCFILEVSILSFFALEGVLVSKTEHSLYIPIAILLIQLVFIHKALYTNLMSIIYLTVFLVLSINYKEKAAYINDIYISVATFLSAIIAYILIAIVRHNEGIALRKCETLNIIDSLTGLYNKDAIENKYHIAIEKENHECAFILFNIASLKYLENKNGYKIGEEIIKKVALVLKHTFSQTDIIGRFGEDNFIVLMDNVSDMSKITKAIDECNFQIANLRFTNTDVAINCNIGVTLRHDNDDIYTIFNRAEEALYKAKIDGKVKYYFEK